MTIDIICPLYNAEDYFVSLHSSLLKQKDVIINDIYYILTKSSDKTEYLLREKECHYDVIEKNEFSHSLIREKAAMKSKADIIVFITQDIVVENTKWLYYLTKNIVDGNCEASYSRQVGKYNNIEKYTREKNYPNKSFTVTKEDINKLGLKTFFFSDAAGAIKTSIFKKLKGYDGKDLPISEDMYFAYKLIMNGYRISYEAESVIYHSHNFSLKELYNRYKLTGKFMKENSYLDKFGTTKAGGGLAKYILIRALQEFNIKVLFRFPFDMCARWFGMRAGKR